MITLSELLNVTDHNELISIYLFKTDGTFEHVFSGLKRTIPEIGAVDYIEKYAPLKVRSIKTKDMVFIDVHDMALDIVLEED